jgi:DNA-binding XRE family transcriptional regulator
MNSLETLAKEIQLEMPQAKLTVDRPESESGIWYLDVNHGDHSVTIRWKPEKPFGVSTPSSIGYGERAHEVYSDRLSAAQRVLQLLHSGQKTSGTRTVTLKDVRPARGMTQEDLAKKLRMEQGSLSKFEKRRNVQINTLARVINALGGRLEIYARFPDESFRVVMPAEKRKGHRKKSTTKTPRAKAVGK